MKGYGSFCPVAKAAEILTERWTPLVLRELLLGSYHFNQLRRGIPQMSPTLLSKRLQTLEEAGLISRQSADNGHWEYHPTQAAREAWPIIDAMGYWGHKWARSQLTPDELHVGRLMWNMRRSFDLEHIQCDFVLYIEIADARRGCHSHPVRHPQTGHESQVTDGHAPYWSLYEVWANRDLVRLSG